MPALVSTFATKRFTLRPIRPADAALLLPTLSDAGQCRFLTRPAFTSLGELEDWLFDPDWDGRTWIAEDGEGSVAGRFVAVPAHEEGVVEIGYLVCVGRQRQGVARECTSALVRHLFQARREDGGARKIVAEVDAANTASIGLLERLGFTREALFREHETTHEGLCDVAMYGLLQRDWAGGPGGSNA